MKRGLKAEAEAAAGKVPDIADIIAAAAAAALTEAGTVQIEAGTEVTEGPAGEHLCLFRPCYEVCCMPYMCCLPVTEMCWRPHIGLVSICGQQVWRISRTEPESFSQLCHICRGMTL